MSLLNTLLPPGSIRKIAMNVFIAVGGFMTVMMALFWADERYPVWTRVLVGAAGVLNVQWGIGDAFNELLDRLKAKETAKLAAVAGRSIPIDGLKIHWRWWPNVKVKPDGT